MERGIVLQEVRTTQPEQPSRDFLRDAAEQLAQDLGVDLAKLYETGRVSITHEEVASQNHSGATNNWLGTLLYWGSPAAITHETRDERNNVLTQCVYYGPVSGSACEKNDIV